MKILSIETSADETAVAILEAEGDTSDASYTVLGDALYSQASKHTEYGGIYPTLAKREHQKNLIPLATKALTEANLLAQGTTSINQGSVKTIRDEEFRNDVTEFLKTHAKPDIDLIAVTQGPGLEPALWTGVTFAESLSKAWNIPVLGVDHMEGHIVSGLVERKDKNLVLSAVEFPVLAFLISGGHTEFVLMKDWFKYELVGKTKDDAIGEAYDKVARLLGFPYPGGPEIDKAAARAREKDTEHGIKFPRPLAHDDTCDFSFSGLKTAVLYKVQEMSELTDKQKDQFAEAFETAVVDVVSIKTKRALERTGARALVVGGGVSANQAIRGELQRIVNEEFPNITLSLPDRTLTGDNAVMIGVAGHLRHVNGHTQKEPLKASGSQTLSNQV